MRTYRFNLGGSELRCIAILAALLFVIGAILAPVIAQQSQNSTQSPWNRCCGTSPWPGQGGMMGRGMMGGMMGSMARHHYAMMNGVPSPYSSMSNPLPRTSKTVERGRIVYEQNCSSCHGTTGLGDGEAARGLSPPPANLALLSQMPMAQWDPFMYWTVAEGGSQFGTAMPAFKGGLSKDDTWAVIAYIQAHLPAKQ